MIRTHCWCPGRGGKCLGSFAARVRVQTANACHPDHGHDGYCD